MENETNITEDIISLRFLHGLWLMIKPKKKNDINRLLHITEFDDNTWYVAFFQPEFMGGNGFYAPRWLAVFLNKTGL